MHYVGLSCVRISSAVHILNLNEEKIKVTEINVKNEMSRLRTQASLVPLAVLQTNNSPQTKTIVFQSVRSLHLHIDEVITIFKKPMSTFLLNQNFACQIEMIHISSINLP